MFDSCVVMLKSIIESYIVVFNSIVNMCYCVVHEYQIITMQYGHYSCDDDHISWWCLVCVLMVLSVVVVVLCVCDIVLTMCDVVCMNALWLGVVCVVVCGVLYVGVCVCGLCVVDS